jgi:hypothetical protein
MKTSTGVLLLAFKKLFYLFCSVITEISNSCIFIYKHLSVLCEFENKYPTTRNSGNLKEIIAS